MSVKTDRTRGDGYPTYGVRMHTADTVQTSKAGPNVNSSGDGEFFDKNGTVQMTIGTSGVTFLNSATINTTALTLGDGSVTTGNVFTLTPMTALTTGQGIKVSSSATAITTTGRLFLSDHTGATGTSAILNEFKTAANDETVLLTLTAASLTTGTVLDFGTTAGLTTGIAVKIAHTTSVIADGGSLIQISSSSTDTGGATNGTLLDVKGTGQLAGTQVRFDSIQTTGTVFSIIGTGVMVTTGNLLTLTGNSATTAAGLLRLNANGLTSGIGAVLTSSATAITGAGRILFVNHTGTTTSGGAGILNEFTSAATDGTVVLRVTGSSTLTGVALQVSVAGIVSGVGIGSTDNTALTTGQLVSIASSATAITTTGRLFKSNHTGATGTSAILNEFLTSANDETNLIQFTASSVTTGVVLTIAAAGLTTGSAIVATDNTALTSGVLVSIASSATAITGAGRLLFSNHTGATGTSAILNEFKSAANDETIILQVTATTVLATGIALKISTASMTTGTGISMLLAALTTGVGIQSTDNTALTTGQLLSLQSAATAIATTGRMILSYHSGATGTSAVLNEFKSDANDETVVCQINATAALALGVALNVSVAAITTGFGIKSTDNTALTSGILVSLATSATAITGAGRLLRVDHTGATTSAGAGTLSEFATAAADGTVLLKLTASAALTGVVCQIAAASLATGTVMDFGTTAALTTGIGLKIAHTTSVIADTGSLVRITSSSTDTGGATNGTLLDVKSTGQLAGTVVRFDSIATTGTVISVIGTGVMTTTGNLLTLTANSATTATGLVTINANGLTTGAALNIVSSSADTTARFLQVINNSNAAAVGAVPLKIINAAVQGTGSKFIPFMRVTEGVKVFTMWLSIDATTPNGNLTGVVGDVCYNGPGGRLFECSVTGTTWIAANA